MKYIPLDAKKQRSFFVNDFAGGFNGALPANCIEDNELSEAFNVCHRQGKLQKRLGLSAKTNDIISNIELTGDIVRYKQYSNPIFYEGAEYSLISACQTDLYSCEMHHIYLVNDEKQRIYLGHLTFNRTASNVYYLPISMVFFSGKATNGIGIYAMVKTADRYANKQFDYKMFEAPKSGEDWLPVTEFYTPTIYVNGRGNRYEYGCELGEVSDIYPLEPESVNLLNGSFKAYFTADSISSVFRLPICELSDESPVYCRVYDSPSSYSEWEIPAGSKSNTIIFHGLEVKAIVDRSKGVISFFNGEYDYSIPVMEKYKDNNICIWGRKAAERDFEGITSSTCCTALGNTLLFSGGKHNNVVYCARSDNPLYFPLASVGEIGNSNDCVTALKEFKNKVLAFKQNSIYEISVNSGRRFDQSDIITDSDARFYSADKLSIKRICDGFGCVRPTTIKQCFDSLVWLDTNNNILTMNGGATSIREISFKIGQKIADAIEDFYEFNGEITAAVFDGNYALLVGNKAFVMNFSVKGMRYPTASWKTRNNFCGWYYYEFPEDIMVFGGFSPLSNTLMCALNTEGRSICYFTQLKEKNDCIFYKNEEGILVRQEKIPFSVATKVYSLGELTRKKLIEKISIIAKGKMKLEYLTPNVSDEYRLVAEDFGGLYIPNQSQSVKILTGGAVRMLGIRFSGKEEFCLEEIEIKYRNSAY